ncbi:BTB/POZ domain-containing protein [Ditylenchus destructor]|nr:BTB/POZ domain-containing protein [Ditylenchus destructor]
MSETNSATNSEWIRLNVGGKIFQTTKDTLSRHPDTFLARLANGDLPSDKDDTGAILIDRSYEHFDTILNFFRSGVVNLDRNEKAMKELLSEADFYNIQPLVDQIRKAMGTGPNRAEMVIVSKLKPSEAGLGYLLMSEKRDDYEVLQALRQKFEISDTSDCYIIKRIFDCQNHLALMYIELILRSFGFVKEEISREEGWDTGSWKFVRIVRQ